MPSSIATFNTRARRMSSVIEQEHPHHDVEDVATKRHTYTFSPTETEFDPQSPVFQDLTYVQPAVTSPTRTSFNFTPDRRSGSQKKPGVWVKKPNASQRESVDETMSDIFSPELAKIRRGHELHQVLFEERHEGRPLELTRRASTIGSVSLLRRRKSYIDARPVGSDSTFVGEVRGSVIPVRHARSTAAHRRSTSSTGKRFTIGDESTESETVRAFSELTDDSISDFGALSGRGVHSRTMSSSSFGGPNSPLSQPVSQPLSNRRSMSNLRRSSEIFAEPMSGFSNMFTMNRRRTMSRPALGATAHNRAKSVPVSPVGLPSELPTVPVVGLANARVHPKRSNTALATAFARPQPSRKSSTLTDDGDDESSPVVGRIERPKAWSSIRRSMSFVFDKNARSGSDDGASRATSVAMTNSDESGSQERSKEDGDVKESDPEISGPATIPKRRRSLRVGGFGPFSRFTPI